MAAPSTIFLAASAAFATGVIATVAISSYGTDNRPAASMAPQAESRPSPLPEPARKPAGDPQITANAAPQTPAGCGAAEAGPCAAAGEGADRQREQRTVSAKPAWSDNAKAPGPTGAGSTTPEPTASSTRKPPLTFDQDEAEASPDDTPPKSTGSVKTRADRPIVERADAAQAEDAARRRKAEQARAAAQRAKAEQARAEHEQARADRARSDMARAERVRAEQARAERTKAVEPDERGTRADDGGRVVQAARAPASAEPARKPAAVDVAARPIESGRPSLAADRPTRTIVARRGDERLDETRRPAERVQPRLATRVESADEEEDDEPVASAARPGGVLKWLMEPGGRL